MAACSVGNDLEDFARLTSVQIGAGKGPDILCGDDLLHDYISGMLDKGALEMLNSFLQGSESLWGMVDWETEDYFSGIKSAEEVSQVINNRVQLYLDEGK